ncbi:MAG TPA: hypothetical protein VLH08_00375 [Acidobacteriota bacterium]|nr:hypothetical protein [Acidobacteriota bacterium]
MKSTIAKPHQTRNVLIIIGIGFGLWILNVILENIASWLAFYFA